VATLLPSFTLPLFRFERGEFRKILGWGAGSTIWQDGELVCCEGCGLGELSAWSGLWALSFTNQRLPQGKPVIGLSVSPWDYHLIFSSVFLSQNTSYSRVLSWMSRLGVLIEQWRLRELRDAAKAFGSYQVRRLTDALRELPTAFRATSLWERRAKLLSIRGVGVKVAHATLLFTSFSGYPIPVDRHLLRRVEGEPPRSWYCRRYPCPRCPLRNRCIAWRLYEKFGVLAGLYQTRVWLESQEPRRLARLLFLAAQLPRDPPGSRTRIEVY